MALNPMISKARLKQFSAMAAVGLITAAVLVAIVGFPITPFVKDKLSEFARRRFGSDLEVSNVDVTLLPISVRVDNLVFRHGGRRDIPPLIRIRRATAHMSVGSLLSMLSSMPSVQSVRLDGLLIQIVRRKAPGESKKEKSDAGKDDHSQAPSFVVNELDADGTILRIYPKDEWKEPMEYDLKSLHMKSVGLKQPMEFVSVLTNATPPGLIHTHGRFGPWSKGDPGMTPVRGEYSFDNANLGHFHGITGILSSKGRFDGQLARLTVDGYTDTPDFSVDVSGLPVHLKTRFHAIVDGTDGDTLLQPVVANFGKSTVKVDGGVYGIRGVKGKTVRLNVDVSDGRIEDMIRFAVKSKRPLLVGPIRYKAKMEIPPGKERVVKKLRLDGGFTVSNGRFSSPKVREKLGNLSNKARGKPEAPPPPDTASNFRGNFHLEDVLLTLRNLSFQVPGATVYLNGTYHLLTEELDFKGTLEMEAKVSETTTGIKSWLLKLVDPLFHGKKETSTEVPITIQGRRSDPKFGVDVGKVLTP